MTTTHPHEEQQYLDLLNKALTSGVRREGRNGTTRTLFAERVVFTLTDHTLPLMTTKRVFWRGVVEELCWFLRGSTDATELQRQGVHIWDKNSTRSFLDQVGLHDVPEGQIGRGYGWQWRRFGGTDTEPGTDQLYYILDQLTHNPHGRRCVLSAWNPQQLDQAALPPCHVLYQFFVHDGRLNAQLYQRSQDLMCGAPFNYASVALLTHLLAHVMGWEADSVTIVTGDTHLYENHVEAAGIQVTRTPYPFPTVRILRSPPSPDATVAERVHWMETLQYRDVELDGYRCHPGLVVEMCA